MIYKTLLGIHILSGFAALASGLVAMLSGKGHKAHRYAGKVYFWAMTVTCLTALSISMIRPNPFLFVVGILSYFSVAIGYRALYLKKIYTGELQPQRTDYGIALLPPLLLALMYILVYFFNVPQKGMEYVNAGLSLYVVANSLLWLRSFKIRREEKQYWMIAHLQGMGGGYIATTTAFLVTNVNFLPSLVVWITPSIIGAAILAYTTRKYQMKFRKSARIAT